MTLRLVVSRRYPEPGESCYVEGERGDVRDMKTITEALLRQCRAELTNSTPIVRDLERLRELLERMQLLTIEELR